MKIQSQLTVALVAFSLVPLMSAIGVGYFRSRDALLETENRRLAMLGTLKAAELRARVDAHTQTAHRLRREFQERSLGDLAEPARADAWAGWLRGAAASVDPSSELVVLDLQGTVIAATRSGLPGRNWSAAPNIAAGRIRLQAMGPHAQPGPGDVVQDVVYVPLTTRDGATVAQLAVVGNGAALQAWLFEDLSPGTRARVTDLDGREVTRWPLAGDPPAGGDDGDDGVESRVRLSPGGATLTLSVPRARILRPIVILGQLGIGAVLLVALAAIGLAVILGRALSRPVRQLAAEARRIGAGDMRPLPAHRPRDEFGALWGAMDQMRADLVATQGRVEQLLAERTRALADRQRLLGSLLEAVPDVVIVVSADRHVAEANQTARALLGADIEGRTCHDVLHGRADACPGCPLDGVLAGQPAAEPELPPSTAGREAVVYSLVPIGAPGAPAERALYTGRIVTRERTLQTRLAHQEKIAAVGALAAGVAHEVRNPLASLSSLVQLRLRAADDAQLRADLAFILDHVERIDRTVKNLTLAAREPASGRRPALLGDLIERAVQLAHFDPRAHGVGLEVRLDPDTPALDLDEDAWLHVLLNLLVNSLDAVEDSAERRVTITLAGGPGGVELEVADTGAGMSPQVLARATEPMFTTKPPGRGTGLGLHLVREVVEQHGGTLELDSQPGRGTVVKIRLPAPERVAAVARAAADGGSK